MSNVALLPPPREEGDRDRSRISEDSDWLTLITFEKARILRELERIERGNFYHEALTRYLEDLNDCESKMTRYTLDIVNEETHLEFVQGVIKAYFDLESAKEDWMLSPPPPVTRISRRGRSGLSPRRRSSSRRDGRRLSKQHTGRATKRRGASSHRGRSQRHLGGIRRRNEYSLRRKKANSVTKRRTDKRRRKRRTRK